MKVRVRVCKTCIAVYVSSDVAEALKIREGVYYIRKEGNKIVLEPADR
ncbi:MAG: hypothetical protein QXK71_05170 [Pyrobaculum sp.]|jgi:hypothetical protein